MCERGYKAWELDLLTLSEISVLMKDRSRPMPPGGAPAYSQEEMNARQDRKRAMTLVERLEAALKGTY